MNVSNNHGSSAALTSSAVGLDAEGQLALLVLENEQTQSDAARQDKAVARERYVEAANRQVAAMHAEADHVLIGAIVQGACTVAATSVQLSDIAVSGDCISEDPWSRAVAGGFSGLSPVLGKAVGDEPAAHDRADAKQASSLEQQAEWQLDDANKAIDEAKKSRDKALDWLTNVNANQASTETGIIAGFA